MQLIIIFSGEVYKETCVMRTAVTESVCQIVCVCVSYKKNFETKSD
jgi:hypothetical protein